MPYYLNRFRYSSETWQKLLADPVDRTEPIRAAIEAAGGILHHLFYAFGDADGYILAEFPDNVSYAAAAIAAAGSGTDRSAETVVLLTAEEMVDALRRAHASSHRLGDTE